MSIVEMKFDCSEVKIEGIRYGQCRVIADNADIDDVMNSIKSNGDVDSALDCIGVSDVIDWIERQGYKVEEEDGAN